VLPTNFGHKVDWSKSPIIMTPQYFVEAAKDLFAFQKEDSHSVNKTADFPLSSLFLYFDECAFTLLLKKSINLNYFVIMYIVYP
jgi:hypothetical protein